MSTEFRQNYSKAGWAPFLLVGLISCALLGCVHHVAPAHAHRDPLVAMKRIEAQAAGIEQLAIDAEIHLGHWIFSRTLNAIVLVRRPGDLRLELLSPTDELVAIVTVNGSSFVAYERGSDVCHVGPPCALIEMVTLPIPLALDQLVDVLLGGAALKGAEAGELNWDEKRGTFVLTLHEGDGQERMVELEACTQALKSAAWKEDQEIVLFTEVRRWQDADGVQVPAVLHVAVESEGIGIDLTYRVVDRHMALDAQAFAFSCPMGTRIIKHVCEGAGDS